MSSFPKRAHISRARASPPGNSTKAASRSRSSPITWSVIFSKQKKSAPSLTGADRIAANGDTANKIGTYQIAVLAKENNVPFYIAAPVSTFDLSIPDGDHIPIEERFCRRSNSPPGCPHRFPTSTAAHPAFDVTPARYIAAIFTERGVARAPYTESLRTLFAAPQSAVTAR